MSNELTVESIIKFIEQCNPNFNYSDNREQHGMFTIATQHIYADSIEELLKIGIDEFEKHGNKSPLSRLLERF